MPDYRIYEINKEGHISGPPAIRDCPDDETAVQEAKRLFDGKDIEVWRGAQRLAFLTHKLKRK
jgi:hypothetical protein